jgi:hypothetical protein
MMNLQSPQRRPYLNSSTGRLFASLLALAGMITPAALRADPIATATVELPQATLFYRESGKGRPARSAICVAA